MPTLDWIGKDKVVNHHLDVPYRVLERQYSYDTDGTHTEDNDSENMIIHGDNLSALKSLLPQYEGKIKCIYIDPPYNTGNENWVYNDNVNDPKIKKWLGDVVGREGEDLSRHDKWLCMMYPRLKLLHRLLADDGAIFISIDDNEQANLKLICDEIFGGNNFVSNIIWQKKTGASDSTTIATITEYIFVYAKNKNMVTFSKNTESYDIKRYKYKDDFFNERGPYYIDNLDRGGLQYSDSLNFGIECPDGSITFPNGRSEYINDGWIWKWSKDKIEWARKNHFIEFRKSKNKKTGWAVCYKNYLKVNNEGKQVHKAAPHKNLIDNVLNANSAKSISQIFRNNVFAYSKPYQLIQHLLNIAIDPNSIILDSFAGSGTTAHAVLNMNKADGGNRKFILVEMEDYAETITAERVRRVINGYGEGKQATDGTGGSFSYYELGDTLMENGKLNESVSIDKIREYVYFTETKCRPNPISDDEPYLLGCHLVTAYYFYYEKERITTLNREFLHTVKTSSDSYVMYADLCTLSNAELEKFHITFKKIPRDISKL